MRNIGVADYVTYMGDPDKRFKCMATEYSEEAFTHGTENRWREVEGLNDSFYFVQEVRRDHYVLSGFCSEYFLVDKADIRDFIKLVPVPALMPVGRSWLSQT